MAKARVLVVDDQHYFRLFLEDLLRAEGYDAHTVSSGEEALRRLARERFDLVLTDLVMPGMDGRELVDRIRQRWPDQEIVVVTSVSDVRTAVDAMRRGATDYLLKPIDRTVLQRALDGILQRQRLRREHARLMAENLEYLGVLSLYERAIALFATSSVEPLAERIVEALCLETRAEGGVIWVARDEGAQRLHLLAARGLVRVENEPDPLVLDSLPPEWSELASGDGRVFAIPDPHDRERTAGLGVPLRAGGALLGFVRLSDKLAGGCFEERDRAVAERFAEPAALALANALRLRAVERRAFRDPVTKAYTRAYFEDVVRNEIHKAGRFGRGFSIIAIELEGGRERRARLGDAEFGAWLEAVAFRMGRVLRTTDLLAEESEDRFAVLLPETDALGAAVLKRRIREDLEESGLLEANGEAPAVRPHLAAVSYPVDGTQVEQLERALRARLAEERTSLLPTLGSTAQRFGRAIEALAARARGPEAACGPAIFRLVLDELARRVHERGLLCLAPGERERDVVVEGLARLDGETPRTEIVLVGETLPGAKGTLPVTRIPHARLGTQRSFLLYYAEGPGYLWIAGDPGDGQAPRVFHAAERNLIEHLAFQLQRELGIPIAR